MPPRKNPPAKRRKGLYCCPRPGCTWTTICRTSYSRHCRSDHSTSFKYICQKCTAGQQFLNLHEQHVGTCKGTKDANNSRRGRKPTYATDRQVRDAFPPAEEETVQELEEVLAQVEREKEVLRRENESLKRENEQLRAEKEELVTKVANLERGALVRVAQETAEEEGQGQEPQVSKEPELVQQVDLETELATDDELEQLLGEKEDQVSNLVEHQLEINMLDKEMETTQVVDMELGMVEHQLVNEETSMVEMEPSLVEHQVVDTVPETGGKGTRRSSRKTGAVLKLEKETAILARLKSHEDSDLLEVLEIEGKGRAVKTLQNLSKGDFVVEYAGVVTEAGVAKEKEKEYAMDISKGSFMYFFTVGNKKYCVDATAESGRLGRLLNHSMLNPNCVTKVAMVDGWPRLYLLAKKDITAGSELVFDYGDRSKASLINNPWLAL